jgi:hypothetical protein
MYVEHSARPIPTEAQWAWLAGLFEGEGSFDFNHKNGVRVCIWMADRDVLEAVDRLVPSPRGIKLRQRSGPNWRPIYVWLLSSKKPVTDFLDGIGPWLGCRRGLKAQEALSRLARNRGQRQVTHLDAADTLARQDRALALRHEGYLFREIGEILGDVTGARARQLTVLAAQRH